MGTGQLSGPAEDARAARFITIEGVEGAGKSTQARLLADALEAAGVPALVTREPGGAPGAEKIRARLTTEATMDWAPLSEALLHYAARKEHVDKTVKPALAGGRWVISDRFADSTMAYQGYAQGLGPDVVARLHRLVLGDFRPDLTLILDLSWGEGSLRVDRRAEARDRYERMDGAFHRRVRDAFRDIARTEGARCVLIDGARSVDDVHADIRRAVATRFGIGL